MSAGVVVGLVVVSVVAAAAVGRGVVHALVRSDVGNRVDDLTHDLIEWRIRHSDRIVGLGRQMSRVERAVARAEDEARRASRTMDELARDVVRRMEAVEKDMEIELLVAQGRIPAQHRRAPEPDW